MLNKKKSRIITLLVLFSLAMSAFAWKTFTNAKAGSVGWNFGTSEFRSLGTLTDAKTIRGLSMIATSDKDMQIKDNSKTLNGKTYDYCLALKGKGTLNYRSVKVPISNGNTLKVILMSSGNVSRNLLITNESGAQVAIMNAGTSLSQQTFTYKGSSKYLYLYSYNSGINLYKVEVVEGSSDTSTASPVITKTPATAVPSKTTIPVTSSPVVTKTPTQNPTTAPTDSSSDNSSSGQKKTITSTIVVNAGETYDGKGITIVASGMGDGGQDEGQSPIFKLMNGASLKNVTIASPGCDGVHCYGNNTITNVVWQDVGEDALTVKGSTDVDCGTISIEGGSAKYATDKMFQINAPCTFKVNNFSGYDMGKFIRQNGGTSFKVTMYISNCTIQKVNSCLVKSDSSTSKLYYKNINVTDCDSMWEFPNSSQVSQY